MKQSKSSTWIVDDLEKSGLTPDSFTIEPLQNEKQLWDRLGFAKLGNTEIIKIGGYWIHYPGIENFYRLKLKEKIGDAKYLSPKGSANQCYILSEIRELAKQHNPDKPLFITEGEKKATKLTLEGFPCIGLSGVWNFKDNDNEFLPRLDELNWQYRNVYIVFDSDITKKHNVKQAELRLAVELINRGAKPISIRIPGVSKAKTGIDDYLVQNGKDSFQNLLDKAQNTILLHIKENTPTDLIISEISRIGKDIEREKIIKALAKQEGISVEIVRNQISKYNQKEAKVEPEYDPLVEYEDVREESEQLLNDPDLLNKIVKQIGECGYVGEEINKTLLYLAFTSRLFDEAISCVVKGDSSSGKSTLVRTVLNLMPKSVFKEYTAVSAKALYYVEDKDLSHKILTIFEAQGSEDADYSIRSSISEGELILLVSAKDESGNWTAREIRIPARGLCYIETTTKSSVHNENETRLFSLYVDESEQQTKHIIKTQSKPINKSVIFEKNRVFQALQLMLKPYPVYIPYAEYLADNFPTTKVRARRDYPRFLKLIESCCLLHQGQRSTTEIYGGTYLVATVEDYRVAYELASTVLTQTLKELSPNQETFLENIKNKIGFNEEFAKRGLSEIECFKNYSDSTLKKYLKETSQKGYLEYNGEKGVKAAYSLIKLPSDSVKLPSPETIDRISWYFIEDMSYHKNIQQLQVVTSDILDICNKSHYVPSQEKSESSNDNRKILKQRLDIPKNVQSSSNGKDKTNPSMSNDSARNVYNNSNLWMVNVDKTRWDICKMSYPFNNVFNNGSGLERITKDRTQQRGENRKSINPYEVPDFLSE